MRLSVPQPLAATCRLSAENAAWLERSPDLVRPRFKGKSSSDKRTVIDGPCSETKEMVAAFWLWQVKSMQEAVQWARQARARAERLKTPGRTLKA